MRADASIRRQARIVGKRRKQQALLRAVAFTRDSLDFAADGVWIGAGKSDPP